MEKTCNKCNKIKTIYCFSKAKNNKDGYNNRCKLCIKQYDQDNKEIRKIKRKKHSLIHKDRISKYKKEYVIKNKNEIREYRKQYYFKNKDKIKEYQKIYIPTLNNKIARSLRIRQNSAFKITDNKKGCSLNELLGCSVIFFREYIENKFTQGMTWENYGYYGWHFDHIRPCASFDLSDPEQQKICFHYTNYQPLWATTEIAMKYGEDSSYIGNMQKGIK